MVAYDINIIKNLQDVKLTVTLGYSREVPGTSIWIKPSVSIETAVPEGMGIDEFVPVLMNYIEELVQEAKVRSMKLAGLKSRGDK